MQPADAVRITDHVKHAANTGYGNSNEGAALDAYEMQTGNSVTQRNDVMYKMKFWRDASREPTVSATPMDSRADPRDAGPPKKVKRAVDAFALSDAAFAELSPKLTLRERQAAHAYADALGLGHSSLGSGEERRLVLTKAATGWEYVDLSGAVQGPFDDENMRTWLRNAAFHAVGDELCLKRTRPVAFERGCGCCSSFSNLGQVRRGHASCPPRANGRCAAEALLGQDALFAEYASDGETKATDDESETTADDDDEFAILGMIDGLADVVDYSTEDWCTEQIVVEMKCRIKPIDPRTLNLYEVVQLVIYMLFTNSDAGDLVQCHAPRGQAVTAADVHVTRINLADHAQDWWTICVPRLYALAAAVHDIRADDSRRRAWLAATPAAQWRIAAELCDWLPFPAADYRQEVESNTGQSNAGRGWSSYGAAGGDSHAAAHAAAAVDAVYPADVDLAMLDLLPPEIANEIRRQLNLHERPALADAPSGGRSAAEGIVID
mmetsp:Transcript_23362/g.79746  ORF Transcript_23362/g.79746 Transcript_23362/m.79746 type:complete len:494 (+) Transcript_23362:1-1482(+)